MYRYKPKAVAASAVKIASIKKLIISGNAEVTISQNPKSKTLFINEGNEHVSVKKIGDAIYINSHNYAKITVYVDDIYRIEASEQAIVRSEKTLNLKYLQVFSKDFAYVNINANTESLFTSIKDQSNLTLKGNTDLYTIDMDKSSRIALQNFKSKKTDMSASDVFVSSRS